MAEYYVVVAKAIAGLEKNTGEGRRAIYERARSALVSNLRGMNDPKLTEAEITQERLSLEEAIRKVEAEAARRGRDPMPPAPPNENPAPTRRVRFRDFLARADYDTEPSLPSGTDPQAAWKDPQTAAMSAIEDALSLREPGVPPVSPRPSFMSAARVSRPQPPPALAPPFSPIPNGPKVFISYRRIETAVCWRIADVLIKKHGRNSVFIDADIAPGDHFLDQIRAALVRCKVLIVVIGQRWYELKGGSPKI